MASVALLAIVTNAASDPIRDPYVTVGTNDDRQCAGGWLPPKHWGSEMRPARRVNCQAQLLLRAPEGASCVGIELYAPHRTWVPHRTWRLTVRDRWVGRLPQYDPYLDAGFTVEPGARQTIELPLRTTPTTGSEVEVVLAVDPPAGDWRRAAARRAPFRYIAVSRIWLRGNWLAHRDVAIVVLNWKRPQETIACIESLAEADLRGASVLVVDNGSQDGSAETIQARFPEQRIVRLPENRGYSGGNNAGIRAALEAGAKAVLLLNNDTRVAPDFLDPLLWVLNSDSKAAAVSSGVRRSDYPDVLESAYLEIYFGHGIILHYGVNALPREGFDSRREVEVVVGCSVLLSADALRDIGPLDESYFAYHEEVDWCFRARQAGFRIYWQPYSRVWHTKSTSTASLATPVTGLRSTTSGPQLPASMPLPWNPIQTYLGARNAVRFIRQHASLRQKLYFAFSTLHAVPLEFLAAVMRQEAAVKIGAWSYRKALRLYFSAPGAVDQRAPAPVATLTMLRRAPRVLFWAVPHDIRIAHREGRLAQIRAHIRGLSDGLLNRPLPLERLGLR